MLDVNNLLGFQPKTPQKSILRLLGSAGSSGTFTSGQVRNWNTVLEQTGEDLQYTHDTVQGDYVTIVTPGLYIITHADVAGLANFSAYIFKNIPRSLGTSIGASDYPNVLSYHFHAAANDSISHTAVAWLKQGDVITVAVTPANVGANVASQQLTIAKVMGT